MDGLIRFAQRCWHPVYRAGRPVRRWRDRRLERRISAGQLLDRQRRAFAALGWDYDDAVRSVRDVVGTPSDGGSHLSDHYAVFAAIARQRSERVSRILEIGTSSGHFAAFLAKMYPDAEVVTIDLPSDDRRFFNATVTDRTIDTSALRGHVAARDAVLASHPNVAFRAMNSLELCLRGEPEFDLIWVDGDHTFPVVAIDITNALRLTRPGGLIVCDDVARGPRPVLTAPRWGYRETEDTLTALGAAGLVSVSYVLKRTTTSANLDARRSKYLAIVSPTSRAEA